MRRLLVLIALVLLAPAASAEGSFVAGDPSWAPDGTQLAFDASIAGAPADVYAVHADGSHLRDLTSGDPAPNVLPSWGRRVADIAYETDFSNPEAASVRYSIVSPDGGAPRPVATGTAVGPIWWSAGDRYMAFDGRLDADIARTDGTHRASVPNALSGPWAPRALRAAFAIEPPPTNRIHLYTIAANTRARRQLTRGHETVQPFGWSRTGRILFGRNHGAGIFDLYAIRARGGAAHLIASNARQASFSPVGTRVAYSLEAGGIYTVGVDGRHRRRLTTDGTNPKWSPAGGSIAFQAGAHIDLIRPDGSQRHTLVGS